jgi:exodeoxyribonuclease V alpha subunit
MSIRFEGSVIDVIHRKASADGDWAILSVRADAFDKQDGLSQLGATFKVTGILPVRLSMGDKIRCTGEISRGKYGIEFKASEILSILPKTPGDVIDCLAAIFGLGRVKADQIVNAYVGESDIIAAIVADRTRLDATIEPYMANLVMANLGSKWNLHDTESFLYDLGLRNADIRAIQKVMFGKNTRAILTANPYTIVATIGFKKCDAIASALKIPMDADIRLDAGVPWVAEAECERRGHCAIIFDFLIHDASAALAVGEAEIKTTIARLLLTGELVEASLLGQHLLYPKRFYSAEQDVISSIARISAAIEPRELKIMVGNPASPDEYKATDLLLDPDQSEALNVIARSRVSILTGIPGTGKTTIIKFILQAAQDANMTVVLCAPTGMAALRMKKSCKYEATTIHRALGNVAISLADIIVVDEMSMVGIELFRDLMIKVRDTAKVILVGDPDQLPSIEPGNVLTDLIGSDIIPVCRLTVIHRQDSGSLISENIARIRNGEMPIETDGTSFKMIFNDDTTETARITVACASALVSRGIDILAGVQVIAPTNAISDALNRELQVKLNPHAPSQNAIGKMRYVINDKVIQCENDYDRNVINGEIGKVISVGIFATMIKYDEHVADYSSKELSQLRYAYSITFHKSQGSEFSHVILNVPRGCGSFLSRRLIYTGVSRGRRVVVIIGSRAALENAIANNVDAVRYTGLASGLVSRLTQSQPAASVAQPTASVAQPTASVAQPAAECTIHIDDVD